MGRSSSRGLVASVGSGEKVAGGFLVAGCWPSSGEMEEGGAGAGAIENLNENLGRKKLELARRVRTDTGC